MNLYLFIWIQYFVFFNCQVPYFICANMSQTFCKDVQKMNANSVTRMQYESKKSINVVNAFIVVTVQHIFYLQAGKWDFLNGFRSSTHQTHYGLNMHINILTTYLRYYSRIEPLGNISCEIWGLLGNAGPACGRVSECYGPQNAVSDITSILQSPYLSP